MSANISEDFAKYLVSKNYIAGDLITKLDLPKAQGSGQTLRRLWELTDLSANDFADEVARFHGIPRMSLAQLMEASALVGRFSRRFLREMVVFPYEIRMAISQ
jgi:general secretion pathway protein E